MFLQDGSENMLFERITASGVRDSCQLFHSDLLPITKDIYWSTLGWFNHWLHWVQCCEQHHIQVCSGFGRKERLQIQNTHNSYIYSALFFLTPFNRQGLVHASHLQGDLHQVPWGQRSHFKCALWKHLYRGDYFQYIFTSVHCSEAAEYRSFLLIN